jgi:HD domain
MNHEPQTGLLDTPGARPVGRRSFVGVLAGLLACPSASVAGGSTAYPTEVVSIRLPVTPLCTKSFELCRSAAPAFLVNHSLRTYVFGALYVSHQGQRFDAETAFVAAMLHDIGLLKEFSTPQTPFEIDGANRAESLVRESGGTPVEANKVWQAIVLHDMRFPIAQHESPEATLVAAGAGADVGGPEENIVSAATVRSVIAALPRLQFKKRFIALLTDHCVRQPGAQRATWLEGFCRVHSPVPASATEQAILAAPFDE